MLGSRCLKINLQYPIADLIDYA